MELQTEELHDHRRDQKEMELHLQMAHDPFNWTESKWSVNTILFPFFLTWTTLSNSFLKLELIGCGDGGAFPTFPLLDPIGEPPIDGALPWGRPPPICNFLADTFRESSCDGGGPVIVAFRAYTRPSVGVKPSKRVFKKKVQFLKPPLFPPSYLIIIDNESNHGVCLFVMRRVKVWRSFSSQKPWSKYNCQILRIHLVNLSMKRYLTKHKEQKRNSPKIQIGKRRKKFMNLTKRTKFRSRR